MATYHVRLSISELTGGVTDYSVAVQCYEDLDLALRSTQWYEKAFHTSDIEHLDDRYAYTYTPEYTTRIVEMLFDGMPDSSITDHFVFMVQFNDGVPVKCKLVAKEIVVEDGIFNVFSFSDDGWMIFLAPKA